MDATKDAKDGAKNEDAKPVAEDIIVPVSDIPEATATAALPQTAPDSATPAPLTETTISVESKPTEAGPGEPTPVESKPVEVHPAEIEPLESKPVQTTSVEVPPVEAPPAETKAVEEVPVELKQVEATAEEKPVEEKPVEEKPVEEKPVEEKPVEEKPVEEKPVEEKPVEEAPIETKPAEEKPADEKPTDEKPADEKPADEKPAEKAVVEAEAVETKPLEVKPIDEAPVEAQSIAVKPVEAIPFQITPAQEVEDFSDPDSDDLDDLDDMLDDFSTVKLDPKQSPGAPSLGKPETAKDAAQGKQTEPEDAFSEEDFAKQLQAGMADLLGELEKSPDMQAEFEDIFKQIAASEGTSDPTIPSGSSNPAPPQPSAEDASFQDTIRRTMERMQNSGDQATAAAASGGGDDFMSEMLKQLSSGDLGGLGGDGSEEEFSKMLMGMMEQLTNKEILYEPMKELDDKFPNWLAKNRSTTSKEDLKRYEEQQSVVREIVAKFEEKTYSDSNATDREFIVDKMQRMQAAGSPPSDLVGDMASAQEALNPGDEACNPQ
ncbi:Pex19 protein family-domain-containing protein [Dactylonectria estremocensis]|uniref:Pex19 protein family-domain-containing protein n=1 Tax=Dactylonectria estremocensis TaxID=1079267 RepID=A0A9P9F0L0_9HYPO|nr:Pex19 protein family-domain-containing protein [Dactylonectria estremocensis]